MIPAETRRNFDDFNDMYREIELENGDDDIQYEVVERVRSELNQRRLRDVLRWCDGDHYLVAVGHEFEGDYESDDSGCDFDLDLDFDLEDNDNDDDVFNFRFSDPGYGSDYDDDDGSEVSDIED